MGGMIGQSPRRGSGHMWLVGWVTVSEGTPVSFLLPFPSPRVSMTKGNPFSLGGSGHPPPFHFLFHAVLTPGKLSLSVWATFSTQGGRLQIQVPEIWERGGE